MHKVSHNLLNFSFFSTTSYPASIQCLSQGVCENLVRALFLKLNRDLATGLCPEVKLPRVVGGVDDRESTNPNTHGVFFVSRLTAVGHMRHPFKASLGEKWRRLWCLCVRPSARTSPPKWFKTERRRRIFTFFAITSPVGLRLNFEKSGWILRACWSRIYFVCFECSLLKASKQLKILLGLCVWVRDRRSYPSARVQKKNLAFWNNFI
jgi:hypothetical protein